MVYYVLRSGVCELPRKILIVKQLADNLIKILFGRTENVLINMHMSACKYAIDDYELSIVWCQMSEC